MSFRMSKIMFFFPEFDNFRFLSSFRKLLTNFQLIKDTQKMIWTSFLFSSIIFILSKIGKKKILREKVHISPTFWPPQNSQNGQKCRTRKSILLPSNQVALATVWNDQFRFGICQNLPWSYAILMITCLVWYDHYRGYI